MKLQQLRYIREVARNDLNVSTTAAMLYTSQPGISKQIRLLEDELGVEIFSRNGKHLTRITPAGEEILRLAIDTLHQVENIKQVGRDFSAPEQGMLSLATTHTQARYWLPPIIQNFIQDYPDVELQMQQGTPMQIAEMASEWKVDFAIATEGLELFSDLIMMPCYRWNRCVLVRKDHPLAQTSFLTIDALAQHPLVTYVFGFAGRAQLDAAFSSKQLIPRVVFTTTDSDVLKTYVRLGLGVGIVAKMAYDADQDSDLVMIDAGHLFQSSTTKVGFRRGIFLRKYMYDFLHGLSPLLTKDRIDECHLCHNAEQMDALFKQVELPEL